MKRYKIRVIPAAYSDMKEAREWYRKINPELTKRFNQQLKITMEQIRSLPTGHAIRYNDARIANLAVFPYAVHYMRRITLSYWLYTIQPLTLKNGEKDCNKLKTRLRRA